MYLILCTHTYTQKHMLYSHLQRHNDKDAGRTSLQKYSPLTLLQGFERVIQGLHVRGCWRPNINFIFWPHCYDRHVVSCSPDVGVHFIGAFRGPPQSGLAFPYHISSLTLWVSAGNYLVGFPSAPSVGCGLPYHIWSLLSGVRWQLLLGPKLNWVK